MRGANRVTGIGRGIGKIVRITNTTLDGQVYFEMHPDQLDSNLGYYQDSLIVEMYGGMEFGLKPCDEEGIMLGQRLVDMTGLDDQVSNFDYKVERFDDYNAVMKNQSIECHPRSTNGRLATLNFSLKNPFYYMEQSRSIMNIWYPFRSNVGFGSLEFCVRLELIDPDYESEDDDFNDDYFKKRNVTSYVDTKFKVEISEPVAANGYTRYQEGVSEVKMYSNTPYGPKEGLTTYLPLRYNITSKPTQLPTPAPTLPTEIVVPVTTYHCSAPDESDVPGAYDMDRTFKLGQTFRLCVGPTKSYEKDYRVLGFQSIVCENSIRNTTIVDQFGVPNPYTRIDREIMGYTKKNGGIITNNRTLSISSVINGDLAGIFPEGKSFFICRGIVYLESTVEQDNIARINALYAESTYNPTPLFTETMTQEKDVSDGSEDSGDSDRLLRRRTENVLESNESVDPSYLRAESPNTGSWQNEDLQSWDKISSNPNLPIVGTLSIRIDVTPIANENKVSTFVDKSMNKVKDWFKVSSSASQKNFQSKAFVSAFWGSTIILPLLIFA